MRFHLWLTITTVGLFLGPACLGQEQIPWVSDVHQARQLAGRQNKVVLVHFWSENCGPCRNLDRYVFPNPHVGTSVASHCVPVRVNVAEQPGLARQYGINRIPTDAFLSADGQEIWRSVSPENANDYIAMVNRVADRSRAQVDPQLQQLGQTARQQASASGRTHYDMQVTEYQQKSNWPPRGGGSLAPPAQAPARRPPRDARNERRAGMSEPVYVDNPHVRPPADSGWQDSQSRVDRSGGAFQGSVQGSGPNGGNWNVPEPQLPPRRPGDWQPGSSGYSGHAERTNRADKHSAFAPPPQTAAGSHDTTREGWNSNPGLADQTYARSPEDPAARPTARPGLPPTALDGYCPVTLVEATDPRAAWRRGDARWGAIHRGRLYLFVGEAEQARFMADPDGFSPVLSGYDPVRFFDGNELVEGQRRFGVFYRNRRTGRTQIVLFSDEAARVRFEEQPAVYAERVQQAMQENVLGRWRR